MNTAGCRLDCMSEKEGNMLIFIEYSISKTRKLVRIRHFMSISLQDDDQYAVHVRHRNEMLHI